VVRREQAVGRFIQKLIDCGQVYRAADAKDVLRAATEIMTQNPNATIAWRGQADVWWDPIPGLYRRFVKSGLSAPWNTQYLRRIQMSVIQEAVSREFVKDDSISSWAHLQHYGVATALLDVTLDDRAAAWFAVQDDDLWTSDGALFAFDVTALKSPEMTEHFGEGDGEEVAFAWSESSDARISAQKGAFLCPELISGTMDDLSSLLRSSVHGIRVPGNTQSPNGALARAAAIVIPFDQKAELLKILESSGHNDAHMFPDFAGFCASESPRANIRNPSRFGIAICAKIPRGTRGSPCVVLDNPDDLGSRLSFPKWKVLKWLQDCTKLDSHWSDVPPDPVILVIKDGECVDGRDALVEYSGDTAYVDTTIIDGEGPSLKGFPVKQCSADDGLGYLLVE
jgi:hypothetical protein